MSTKYDNEYFSQHYVVGTYAGATIRAFLRYDFVFIPDQNHGIFSSIKLYYWSSRAAIIPHPISLTLKIGNQSVSWSGSTEIHSASQIHKFDGSIVAKPNSSGKFTASLNFKYGTMDATVNITDLVEIPQGAPTAGLEYFEYDRFSPTADIGFYFQSGTETIVRTVFQVETNQGGETSIIERNLPPYAISHYPIVIYINDKNFTEGKSYKIKFTALAENGKTATVNATLTIQATVHKISIGSLSLNENSAPTKLPYTLINNYKATNFAEPGVTFSSNNPAVATIDQNGIITVHSNGYAIFTVTSKDRKGGYPSASKYFYIASVGGFPFGSEEETTEYLSAELADRIITACQMVATKQGISITGISQFSGYTTLVRYTRTVMERINGNVKKIADTKGITYDPVALTFSETNTNGEWYEMTNEWLRLMPLFRPYA